MSEQDGGFGRRVMQPGAEARPMSGGGGMSPLVKQIGGVALGILLAFSISGIGVYSMKQAGKSLDQAFVERLNAGNPAAAIERAGDDELLKHVHRVCTARAATADLTEAQKRATRASESLHVVELRLVHAAAYVACLTREQPQRFCQKPHRDHLFEAVRQYFKLVAQAREEWQLQTRSPAAAIARPIDSSQLAPIGMPSSRMDPQLQDGLIALDANGYIPATDFARLVPNGMPGGPGRIPRGMPQPLGGDQTDIQSRKAACG
jgi:hypothetical protein